METQQSLDAVPAPTALGRLLRAATQIDQLSLWAMLAVLIGWFFIDTLVVSLGSLQHGVRFFDMSAVIADPRRIFFGVDTPVQRILFGLICLACLLAPLAAHFRGSRAAWLAYLVPLALMVVCGALLYSKTSGEFFSAPSDANSLSGSIVRFANNLARQGSGLVSKHISVAAGGYLAFAGSLLLAVRGIRHVRRRAA